MDWHGGAVVTGGGFECDMIWYVCDCGLGYGWLDGGGTCQIMAKLQTKLQKRPHGDLYVGTVLLIWREHTSRQISIIPPNRLQFPAKSTGASRHKDAASRQDDLWLPTKTGITHSILVGLT